MTTQEALFSMATTLAPAPADLFAAAVPEWLADQLEDLNPPRRSAYAKLVPCGRCGAPVLHAADMGLDLVTESTVDPLLLTPDTEVEVLLAGRYVVELEVLRFGRGIMFYRRDRWLILKPASTRKRFPVPQHRCGSVVGVPLPWQLLYPQPFALIHNPLGDPNDEPPF